MLYHFSLPVTAGLFYPPPSFHPPAATGTRRYCQNEAVTGANRDTGSTSNIPNKGAYSLFMSGTLAAVYKHSTQQSICIYCDFKKAVKSFKRKGGIHKIEENSYTSDSWKMLLTAQQHNNTKRQGIIGKNEHFLNPGWLTEQCLKLVLVFWVLL